MPGSSEGSRALDSYAPPSLHVLVVITVAALMPLLFHVVHRATVPFPESMPIVVDKFALNLWVAVPLVVVCILVAAIGKIVPRRLDAIAESHPLRVAILRRRLIPTTLAIVLPVLRLCGRR